MKVKEVDIHFRGTGYSWGEGRFIFKKGQVWDSVILCLTVSVGYVAFHFNSSLRCTFVLCTFFSMYIWPLNNDRVKGTQPCSLKSAYNFWLYIWPFASMDIYNHGWKQYFPFEVRILQFWICGWECKDTVFIGSLLNLQMWNLEIWGANLFNPPVSGPAQFKPVLFQNEMYYIWQCKIKDFIYLIF